MDYGIGYRVQWGVVDVRDGSDNDKLFYIVAIFFIANGCNTAGEGA